MSWKRGRLAILQLYVVDLVSWRLSRRHRFRAGPFDVADDPGEVHNLLGENPDEVAQLEDALATFVQQSEGRRPGNWEASRQLSLDDEALADRLRALGYLE